MGRKFYRLKSSLVNPVMIAIVTGMGSFFNVAPRQDYIGILDGMNEHRIPYAVLGDEDRKLVFVSSKDVERAKESGLNVLADHQAMS